MYERLKIVPEPLLCIIMYVAISLSLNAVNRYLIRRGCTKMQQNYLITSRRYTIKL